LSLTISFTSKNSVSDDCLTWNDFRDANVILPSLQADCNRLEEKAEEKIEDVRLSVKRPWEGWNWNGVGWRFG